MWSHVPSPIITCSLCLLRSGTFPFLFFEHILHLMEAKFTRRKISHFKVNNSVAFSTLAVVCNHHLYLVLEHFHPSEITRVVSLVYILPCLSPSSRVHGNCVYVCGYRVLPEVGLYFVILQFIFPTK